MLRIGDEVYLKLLYEKNLKGKGIIKSEIFKKDKIVFMVDFYGSEEPRFENELIKIENN